MLDSTVVFNEVLYHPRDDASLEWIELHNQMSVDVDLSGWSLQNGIEYTFPAGTILSRDQYLVVAASPEALQTTSGYADALGPFRGQLNNGGERLELRNHANRLMDVLQYDDDGDWPVGADGSGASLAKIEPQSASGPAENWTVSLEVGGTPGQRNFAKDVRLATLLPLDARWRFEQSATDQGDAWRQADFDDGGWSEGQGLFFATSRSLPGPKNTPLTLGSPTYYFRTSFEFSGDPGKADLQLRHVIDDGAVFYLNGQEVGRFNMSEGPVTFDTLASRSVSNAKYQILGLPSDALVQGTNTLAVEVHQIVATSNDVVFGTELLARLPQQDQAGAGRLQISEVAAAKDAAFWVELHNPTDEPVTIGGQVLATSADNARYSLPAQTIAPGGYQALDLSGAGWQPQAGERLFLYVPDQSQLIDAVRLADRLQGRSPDHQGRWQFPQAATPGAPNQFSFQDAIVINEVMYHARPTFATPAVFRADPVIAIDASWQFDQSGSDQGTAWREPDFDDRGWQSGRGLFFAETTPLPAPENTPLELGQTTYYFRTSFDWSGPTDDVQLALRHVVDDGAIFYLNGVEFLRYNLSDGPVTFQTDAQRSVGNASVVGPVVVPADLLVPGRNVLAVEVHQRFSFSPDVVFGAELNRMEEVVPASPFQESDEEWIELYNRSDQTVDLSGWRLQDAISFEFPANTTLGPDQYLVVARNATSLAARHPGIRIAGQFDGSLSNKQERIQLLDQQANLADEVHYYEGGRWPAAADGGGSSLELRDPRADNSRGEAWAASDESGRSEWQHFSYTRTVDPIVHDPPIHFHEFVMGLIAPGEVLVDNISVIESPGEADRELIQNGSFENDTLGTPAAKWRLVGTHERSHVIQDPDRPDNKVLHLIAEARMNYLSNHAETTLADGAQVVNGRTYQISFDAKWISGSPQLHTELYYKDAARTTILSQPSISGTPGQPNSRRQTNWGPTFDGLRHEPVIPSATDDVTVRVEADDPDGIASMQLLYAIDGVAPFTAVPMTRDASGQFVGVIPSQPEDTVVQFYVQGQDRRGAVTMFPAKGPDSRALYKVQSSYLPDRLRHDLQLIMISADVDTLHERTNMIDNNRLGSTAIYDGREVFYDVGTRLKGSMFSRQNISSTGYNVRFHPDQPFRGVHETLRLDQNGEAEILVKHFAALVGNLGGSYDDVLQLTTPSGRGGGPTLTFLAAHDDIFLSEQFENGQDGTLFKFEGIRVMQTTVDRDPESLKLYQPIGWVPQFDLQDLGNDKELYRWPFLIHSNRDRDDYRRIIDLAKAFSLTGQALDNAVAEVMDVDQWMSTFAIMSLFGIGDAYSQGNPHNLNLYVRPADNKVLAFPWDWDFVFNRSPNSPLHGNKNIGKIIERPNQQHLFLGHLHHMVETQFRSDRMQHWIDHFGSLLGERYQGYLRQIDRRREIVLERLPDQVDFQIETAADELTIDAPAVTLQGKGWINVRQIRPAGQAQPLNVTWLDETTWQATIPLQPGENQLMLEAIDFSGQTVGSDQVTITSTVARPLLAHLRISEIMYHPADPSAAEIAAGFASDEDFEFIELLNTSSTQPLDLAGVRLQGGVQFTFPDIRLQPNARIVVASHAQAFVQRYGEDVALAGQYTGRLNNGGEELALADPTGALILSFAYDDDEPWPVRADGTGASLELIDPLTSVTLLGRHDQWRGSLNVGGSPGRAGSSVLVPGDFNGDRVVDVADVDLLCDGVRSGDLQKDLDGDGRIDQKDLAFLVQTILKTQFGDANLDGTFDSRDLLQVFQAGEYEDKLVGNSNWAEGDWNCDGEFGTADLVAAFRSGGYLAAAQQAVPSPGRVAWAAQQAFALDRTSSQLLSALSATGAANRQDLPSLAAPQASQLQLQERDRIFAEWAEQPEFHQERGSSAAEETHWLEDWEKEHPDGFGSW